MPHSRAFTERSLRKTLVMSRISFSISSSPPTWSMVRVDIAPYATDLARPENHPAACGGFDDVEHFLADPPGMHEQAFKPEAVGQQPQPEQVAVNPGQLAPDGSQVLCTRRHIHVHQGFDRLAIALAVDETADAADALGDIDNFGIVLDFASVSRPRWINPMEGRASTTFSSSTTRSRWIGSGNTGCCGPKGMTVRAIKIYLVASVVAGGVVAQGAAPVQPGPPRCWRREA